MAASCGDGFDVWLSDKLTKICADVDLDVFVQYIRGVLETDSDLDEKKESITDMLGQITEEDLQIHCDDVIKKWDEKSLTNGDLQKKGGDLGKDAFDINMASAIEAQKVQKYKTREVSAEDKARKEAILAQYSQVSDGDGSDVEAEDGTASHSHAGADRDSSTDLLTQNVNALSVALRQQDERVKSKSDHDAKKAKDKEDREKQKQKEKDRKEGEKKRTQKGERRR